MINTTFGRLFWKEYRIQRALWISMALLAVFFLLLIHLFALNSTERYCWQLLAGLALPAFYCLGCGATLFAGEREGGTYEFQRSLPVRAKTVFAAKFSFALASGAAMFVLAGLTLMLLHPGTELNPTDLANRYALGIAKRLPLLGLEMLLWATLFSLLLRRVLVAAILGVLVGSINFDFSRGWYSQLWGEGLWVSPELAVVTALVILADVWFGLNWFREKRDKRMRPPVTDMTVGEVIPTNMLFRPSSTTAIARLVWQHWRESGRLAMILLGTTILPLLVIGIEWLAGKDFVGTPAIALRDGQRYINDPLVFFFGFFPAFLGVSLLGLTAFHSDQWGRGYRFLSDRGVSPKNVWMSRQLVCWGSVVLALPLLMVAIYLLVMLPISQPSDTTSTIWLFMVICGWVIGYAILSISVGQFFSMFLHSGILAGVFSIITTLVLAAWCWLMWIWKINWLWSMLPIPIFLLLATWLRTSDWLVERNTFRAWLRPGLALIIPTIALLTVVPLYRVYQIPLVDPGFSLEEYNREMTSDERATLDQYEQAIQKLKTSREEALLLAIDASRRELFDKNNVLSKNDGIFILTNSLIDSATALEREGKLDEALDRYFAALRIAGHFQWYYPIVSDIERSVYERLPTWATQPGQTPERILAAQRQLEEITSKFSMSDAIKIRYIQLRGYIEGNSDTIAQYFDLDEDRLQSTAIWLNMPWEKARSLRFLNSRTRDMLALLANVDREAATDRKLWNHDVYGPFRPKYRTWSIENFYPLENLVEDYLSLDEAEIKSQRAAIETQRRAVRIILALEAWKLQHGSLPEKLDELVGACIDRLPTDPYTDEPFLYFPEGLQTTLIWRQGFYRGNSISGEIAVGKPFLWSSGTRVQQHDLQNQDAAKNEPFCNRYWIIESKAERTTWYVPNTENEVLSSGWPFSIP